MTAQDNPGPSLTDPRSTALGRSAAEVRARLSNAVRRLPPKARFALSLGLVAAVLLGASVLFFRPPATLRIVCRHDFRSAEIAVSVDGHLVHTDTMTGAVKRWHGVVTKTEGTYTRTLPVGPGRHAVEIRLRAPGYDASGTTDADFSRGKESTLNVDSGRGLSLAWREAGSGGSTAEASTGAPGASAPWFRYAGSVLLTLLGSVISASIGVLVQDFLRSRRSRPTEAVPPQSSKTAP